MNIGVKLGEKCLPLEGVIIFPRLVLYRRLGVGRALRADGQDGVHDSVLVLVEPSQAGVDRFGCLAELVVRVHLEAVGLAVFHIEFLALVHQGDSLAVLPAVNHRPRKADHRPGVCLVLG